jgi:hypothetical protein
MTRFIEDQAITGTTMDEKRLRRVEEELNFFDNRFFNTFLRGRLRTDRNAPTSSTDIETGDQEFDIVRESDYQYTLVNLSGTLTWLRAPWSTF